MYLEFRGKKGASSPQRSGLEELLCFQMPAPVDHFDRLPNSLVLLIFNKVGDIKALGRCAAVSKRFNALVPQVSDVIVKVDCVISGDDGGSLSGRSGRGIIGVLVRLVLGSIVKPLQALQQVLGSKKVVLAELSHHSPSEVLKNFKEIENLRIELPGGELGVDDGVLLRWRAEFGSTLESCVILGATSYEKNLTEYSHCQPNTLSSEGLEGFEDPVDDNGGVAESFYTNGGLKLRVVWTISSLIAASARHFLLQQIISDHPTLRNLVLTDADGQGVLCMEKEQLKEYRDKPLATSASANRTQVPALNMKLWYAQSLDIPGIGRMEGATLVAIKPSNHSAKDGEGLVFGAFGDEPFAMIAKEMLKKKTYLLEMNSF
eukprot:TRINITY_DN443_c1_g1_i2.p1 TRINITY_DN443_c1_g1~~TRINITY_DN443_c1_g1_i2.p1  ORF type:complete len:375 (+),score=47.96 TRINITY_DN443_c1_g1_i2:844-1968(+)